MTGIRDSKATLLGCALACAGLCAGITVADTLTLRGGVSRLSGNVVSINESGVVELASGISDSPLLLKEGSVRKIEFSNVSKNPVEPGTRIELANGDVLPGTIERLDRERLHFVSPHTGRLEIPRQAVKSIQTGIRARNLVFEGPNSMEEWTVTSGDRNNLTFENGVISANGPATFSKKLDLPQQFIVRFNVSWNSRNSPNFQLFLADPMLPVGDPVDRYFLQFSGAGLEIKREAAQGKRYNTIVILNRTHDQFPDSRMEIELRVNRQTARMELRIDGQSEGEFADPIPGIPTGSGISFVSNTPNGIQQQFRAIEVMEFDDRRDRHPSEDRGDASLDSLITREDDRWSGNLTEIKPSPDGLLYVFTTGFKDRPMEIPESDVSMVFMARPDDTGDKSKPSPFVIRLHGEGVLGVSSSKFGDGAITAKHPLLGTVVIPRDGILAFERDPLHTMP